MNNRNMNNEVDQINNFFACEVMTTDSYVDVIRYRNSIRLIICSCEKKKKKTFRKLQFRNEDKSFIENILEFPPFKSLFVFYVATSMSL